MPQFAMELTSTTPHTPVVVYRGAETGRLKSICANLFVTTYPVASLWIEVGTMLGGRGEEFITAVFYSGYASHRIKALWIGDYPLSPYEEIYVRGCSYVSTDIRITGKIETGDP